jgi:hypothetical protein
MAAVVASLVVAPSRAVASSYPLNPAHNIAPPKTVDGPICSTRPRQIACEDIIIAALNHARSVMGEPPYALPGRFRSLGPRDQLLVLSNLDRALYGRLPIRGISRALSASAASGVAHGTDPQTVKSINGNTWRVATSNWAGGTGPMGSPLFAYYEWMYNDGYSDSPFNADCQSRTSAGCWDHRADTLFRAAAASDQIEMGVAGGQNTPGHYAWTELYEAFGGSAQIPCIPSVTRMSTHTAPTNGASIVLRGYGFVNVTRVTVLGRPARITDRHLTSLTVRVPRHDQGVGYVAVYTSSGRSGIDAAAAFSYIS